MKEYKEVLLQKLYTHYKVFIYILCLTIIGATYFYFNAKMYAKTTSESLSEQVIRFHVLANSDTTYDQLLKADVRDAVLQYMEPKLKEASSIEESRAILIEYLQEIEEVAASVVTRWGEDYSIHVELTNEHFPTKAYGDIVFPAGEYEACRILIGSGQGENWWCVMFPPLCYVDAATGTVPLEGKEALEANLTDEQYQIVAEQSDRPYQIKFKVLEWFGK